MVERTLHAENVPTIHVGISPNHRSYRRFRAIARPGCLAIERSAYQEQNAALEEAYHGQLSVEDATRLFEAIVSVSVSFLPNARRADSRIEHALEMLQENPSYPLKDLACAVGLSYDRMSYLFAETIGLPLRSYLLWQKLHKVASLLGCGKTLTEIALAAGFTDSAHLSNTYQKTYGITPSYFLKSDCVEIHSLCLQATVSAVA
ncbi:MAG: hypothetical protein A2W18_01680 [Candidatus Muproteobacteria bacterium RBG_16_60_9]|uniref:HTH araC/xylS-type domain-containing protein n=1 Tax=Candidatus Muproteobacteria bacterium RBG_16_60_9 TaxID=1817755 RepID=A0A1F6VB64_9PROT|nr:MAG: hypothetical protein A2W18_01680 [Candidatus Muproteobacteria bacterium RBG_16_60_9]